jgi:uncharacterized protein YjbI with pentapeptide repeats
MAKPEHLDMLIESVEDWNAWRDDNPSIVPALWGADLEEADLRGADLKRSDLEEAVLSGADLSTSDLRGAKLRGADLRGANLEGADLMETNLKRADLEGVDLRRAIFLQAEQLCDAKTLYQAELDPHLAREVSNKCPRVLEKPVEKSNR